MPIHVYDYRANLSNLVVAPQIRSRFRRVELGPVPQVHSHDLGGETFVVMEGQIEFTVDGESVVCTPGQAIFVPPRTTHAVRAVGDQTGVMYLSVSPHVEPTHTFYDDDGHVLPPRYGVWRAAGGGEAASEAPTASLLQRYRELATELAELARQNADAAAAAQVPGAGAADGADTATVANGAAGTDGPIKPTMDGLWFKLRAVLQHLEEVERAWNELALRAAD